MARRAPVAFGGCVRSRAGSDFQADPWHHPAHVDGRPAPRSTEWQSLDLDTAIDMVAERFVDARQHTWQDIDKKGHPLRRTMKIAALGGATLDNEENYVIKKLFTATGAIQIENQARI
jgi:formate dehydrogenase major subunit